MPVTGGGEAADVERALAIGYAPVAARSALAALFALDDRLGAILRSTREPVVGQMRLTWWHDALTRLDAAPAPAEPVLASLAAQVLPRGVTGASLATMIDGWEVLLDNPVTADTVRGHAAARGARLFAAAGRVVGAAPGDPLRAAGEGWALADLSRNLSCGGEVAAALAGPLLAAATERRWSRVGRALGAMAHLARMDLARPDRVAGSPARVGRLLWHRLTGR